ncbi:peptide chain release factor N(5)-glutamine methyltransferase [Candidatus Falkowbacteria bacterium]|nr:peptide chain release factor N(5)-glutamine methyltransferase [Candidatus Falkowbacteria bacterium]
MTIKQSLIEAIKILQKNKISSPALDAEILLAFVTKKPKEFLYAHPKKKLAAGQLAKFKKLIARRVRHEPIAYLTDHKYFYGLDFFVDKNVLIPRPETETLVEAAIDKNPTAIIDVGTGSGAIAITLAHHLPKAKIFATEISAAALKVARKNILHHKVAVTLLHGNLLEPLMTIPSRNSSREAASQARPYGRYSNLIIVANLPYLTTTQWRHTQPEIKKYEPKQALDGGSDGLNYYRQLLKQIKNFQVSSFKFHISCFFEIDPSQKKSITKLIKRRFPAAKIKIKQDLAGRNRVVIFKI